MKTALETVALGDVDAFVVRVGAGEPILVCGGPQLGHDYMRTLDFLADAYEVIYFDARGSGRTPLGDVGELTLGSAVADLEALRIALGLEKFVILGHSLGGHMAYLYASRFPEHVAALVLVDVGPPFDGSQRVELHNAMTALRIPADDERLEAIQASPEFARREPRAVEEFIRNIYRPFFRDRNAIDAVEFGFTEITAANVLDYEDRLVASLAAEDPQTRLTAVRCPTLVIHGEIDPIPVAFGRALADSIPGAQFALLPGASHFPFVEDAELFGKAIRAFLAG